MEPLRPTGKFHTVFRSLHDPIPTRNVRAPKDIDEARAMFDVRCETYAGGYMTLENGLRTPQQDKLFREWIKSGVLKHTLEEDRAIQHSGRKRRKYLAALQRELEHFEGPFDWKYGHEGIVS